MVIPNPSPGGLTGSRASKKTVGMSQQSSAVLASTIWRLRAGVEKKFAKGHPWVFSNDLDQSPKGHVAGALVELRDSRDHFLALGYGNPATLISFRTLSRTPIVSLVELVREKLSHAARTRHASGVDGFSHRLLFGEADGVPGLIVDRYLAVAKTDESSGTKLMAQVFVIQSSTAGADTLIEPLKVALESFANRECAFKGRGATLKSLQVLAQDSSSRAIEGLEKKPRELAGDWQGLDPRSVTIAVQGGESALASAAALYDVDFIEGQKTGFFLDQRLNVRLAWPLMKRASELAKAESRELRALDLFSYVGQWSVQIARAASDIAPVRITMADASAAALELAARNTVRAGGIADPRKMDILNGLPQLPVGSFDVVVCDPPAFIKKKKDIPTGRAAYVKLNREAIKRVAPGGVFISCSCSGLLTDEEFVEALADAVRASGRDVTWLSSGGHGEDHPYRSEFPQGRYLKGWIGIVR
jgi:23S rRNA (cytosine1962-C5)-methyltransferase